ncbi:hypothetical protein VTJ49DRAFT_5909 [Mycothermus thermophilus]|uniref:Autophagy-related protein 101 n=1 Tax=Humicola insolens TaxID=85995 RepID=A0ABR3V2D3_HUMIN
MDRHSPPEFILEAFADPSSVRDIVRGILHTIFFLRYFPTILPQTRDVLGLELAYIPDAEIETLIDQRVAALARQLEAERHQPHSTGGGLGGYIRGGGGSPSTVGGGGRGQITIQFLEKRRRKTWYALRGDDEVPWESWTVKVTVADPRTEGGAFFFPIQFPSLLPPIQSPFVSIDSHLAHPGLLTLNKTERAKLRRASETTLHNTIMKAVTLANAHKDHIPPITTTESNPFPYQIHVGPPASGSSNTNSSSSAARPGSPLKEGPLSPSRSRATPTSGSGGGGGGGGGGAGGVAAAAAGWATRMGIY